MTDNTSQTETPAATENPEPAEAKPTAPAEKTFTQADVDRLIGDRLARQKDQLTANFADYDDLKAAAERLKTIEDAQKSEQQKASDKIAELTKQLEQVAAEAEKANLKALKSDVARTKGVPANRLHGKTQEELEADADAYLAEVETREGAAKRNPPKTPAANLKSGASSTSNNGLSDKARAAKALQQMRTGN